MGNIEQLRGLFAAGGGEAVAEHCVAERTGGSHNVGAGGGEFAGAFVVDTGTGFFAEEGQTAAGAATETAFAVTGCLDETAGLGGHLAGFGVDVLVTAEVAGVVVDDALGVGFAGGEAGEEGTVVLDGDAGAELLVVLTEGTDAVGAGAEHLFRLFESLNVLFGEGLEEQVVAEAAGGVARAALLFQDAEGDFVVAEHLYQGRDDFAALGVVATHATHPEGVFLGAVEEGEFEFFDELVAFGGGEAHGIAIAFEIEEEFAAMCVFPGSGIDCAAAEADEDGQVFNADGALVFAGAAGGALEDVGLGDVFAEEGLVAGDAELIEMGAHAEDDFLWIEGLAGVVGGAVFGAAAAFDAGKRLEGEQLGNVFAGDEAKILVAGEGRDGAKLAAGEEDGGGAEEEVEVLGVGDEGEEDEEGGGVDPPEEVVGDAFGEQDIVEEVGDHEGEDEEGDEAALIADFAEPLGADDHAADGEAADGDGNGEGKAGGEEAVGGAEPSIVEGEEGEAETDGEVVEGDDTEGAEAPKEEGVSETGEGAFADDLGLAEDFPEEFAEAGAEGGNGKAGVFAGGADEFCHTSDAQGEGGEGGDEEGNEDVGLDGMQAFHHYHATLRKLEGPSCVF